MTSKRMVQEQFGANARDYVSSRVHSRGATLQRLVELTVPQRDWRVLDIATGAGHTAFAFAPYVDAVWATDITQEMLALTREGAAERRLDHITVEYADSEALPYGDEHFDLVTCRIAAHHFDDIGVFLQEAVRVLRPNGLLAVVDNVVPEGPAGDYINAFDKLRDPSHRRCLGLPEWLVAIENAGAEVIHHETCDMQLVFEEWAARHDAVVQGYLRALLALAPGEAAAFLQPQTINQRTTFRFQEGIIIGRRR